MRFLCILKLLNNTASQRQAFKTAKVKFCKVVVTTGELGICVSSMIPASLASVSDGKVICMSKRVFS